MREKKKSRPKPTNVPNPSLVGPVVPVNWWLGFVVAVHVIGRYALVEYDSSKPGNAEKDWTSERLFSAFVADPASKRADANGWSYIGHSFHSLEAGLVGVIAYVADGANSQAGHFFMKMIASGK